MATTIAVVCDQCGKRHDVAATHAGRRGKCSSCGALMTVPSLAEPAQPAASESDAGDYGLAEPAEATASFATKRSVSRPMEEPPSSFHRTRQESARRVKSGRDDDDSDTDFALVILKAMPVGLGLVLVLMLLLALAVTGGTVMAGGLACVVGMILSLATFWVGAYAAFREDTLFGLLYVLIPLYTAYYIVTRFDDLKNWAYIGLIGLVLSMIGGGILATVEPNQLETKPIAVTSVWSVATAIG